MSNAKNRRGNKRGVFSPTNSFPIPRRAKTAYRSNGGPVKVFDKDGNLVKVITEKQLTEIAEKKFAEDIRPKTFRESLIKNRIYRGKVSKFDCLAKKRRQDKVNQEFEK